MKLTKRIGISLAILALVATPLVANCDQIQTVVAAKSSLTLMLTACSIFGMGLQTKLNCITTF